MEGFAPDRFTFCKTYLWVVFSKSSTRNGRTGSFGHTISRLQYGTNKTYADREEVVPWQQAAQDTAAVE